MKKEDFYLFIDIIDTLNSDNWKIKYTDGYFYTRGYSINYSPENIMALNSLVTILNLNYNVKLVVFGGGVVAGEMLDKRLKENGLEYTGEIIHTDYNIKYPPEYEVLRYKAKNKITNEYMVISASPKFHKDWFKKGKLFLTTKSNGLTLENVGQFVLKEWPLNTIRELTILSDIMIAYKAKMRKLEVTQPLFDFNQEESPDEDISFIQEKALKMHATPPTDDQIEKGKIRPAGPRPNHIVRQGKPNTLNPVPLATPKLSEIAKAQAAKICASAFNTEKSYDKLMGDIERERN